MSVVANVKALIAALQKRVVDVRVQPKYIEVGPGVPDGWPGPPRPDASPSQLARRPASRTLPRVVNRHTYYAKAGKSFLKGWGSTDPKKARRRRGRLASLSGQPEPVARRAA